MLRHPTLDTLWELRLLGMAKALEEQLEMDGVEELDFLDRLGFLVDREATVRESRSLTRRQKRARLRENAAIEDVDFRTRRGLDKRQFLALASCDWIREHLNVLITGATGVGKTFLGCALAQKACRERFSVLYARLPRLLSDLALAHADGRHPKLLASFARTDVLVLDDWGLAQLNDRHRRDLLEIVEDRCGRRSTLITSQLPVEKWHDAIGDPTLADAILDRIVHGAYRINLEGESMRKTRAGRKSP